MRLYPGNDSIKEKARLIRRLTQLIPSNKIYLSEMVLQGADLAGCVLKGTKFERAILDGANLSNTDLSQADMREASLIGCDFSFADVNETNFNHANLSSSNLISTRNLIKSKNLNYSTLKNAMIHPSLKKIWQNKHFYSIDSIQWIAEKPYKSNT